MIAATGGRTGFLLLLDDDDDDDDNVVGSWLAAVEKLSSKGLGS